ncbi:hypothetical protein [Hymenobacter terrenus]|uniref:hypothetical protein n=1 Tax=Hymenobacter terrenus TaxID=1629124 RepID=UPI000619621E|nr:hypothetical protein [Hymenobacter terrenus]
MALLTTGNHPPVRRPLASVPAFTLGVVTTRVSLPGNLYDKAMSQLDPAKGHLQEQVQRIMSGMSAAEQQQAQAQAQQNPGLTMMALMLPRKATIYVRGQEARATTDALTYHLENYFNGAKNTGLCLFKSQSSPKQIVFHYAGAKTKQEWQSLAVTDAEYTVQPTTETGLVAGYPCVKTRYTRKSPAPATARPEPGPLNLEAVALDVWTSSKMPVALNFAHPIYVQEKQGIMKIVVYFDQAHTQQMLYEFTSVQTKPVTPQDLHIATTGPVLDYSKDGPAIGLQLLGLMMGAPSAPGSPSSKE